MTNIVALLYQDKKQGLKFLEGLLIGKENYAYSRIKESAIVVPLEGNTVEYVLCKCDLQSVMDRFCWYRISNYMVTDPDEYYHGEPLMFIVSRIRG